MFFEESPLAGWKLTVIWWWIFTASLWRSSPGPRVATLPAKKNQMKKWISSSHVAIGTIMMIDCTVLKCKRMPLRPFVVVLLPSPWVLVIPSGGASSSSVDQVCLMHVYTVFIRESRDLINPEPITYFMFHSILEDLGCQGLNSPQLQRLTERTCRSHIPQ